jgi:hypothetical protein
MGLKERLPDWYREDGILNAVSTEVEKTKLKSYINLMRRYIEQPIKIWATYKTEEVSNTEILFKGDNRDPEVDIELDQGYPVMPEIKIKDTTCCTTPNAIYGPIRFCLGSKCPFQINPLPEEIAEYITNTLQLDVSGTDVDIPDGRLPFIIDEIGDYTPFEFFDFLLDGTSGKITLGVLREFASEKIRNNKVEIYDDYLIRNFDINIPAINEGETEEDYLERTNPTEFSFDSITILIDELGEEIAASIYDCVANSNDVKAYSFCRNCTTCYKIEKDLPEGGLLEMKPDGKLLINGEDATYIVEEAQTECSTQIKFGKSSPNEELKQYIVPTCDTNTIEIFMGEKNTLSGTGVIIQIKENTIDGEILLEEHVVEDEVFDKYNNSPFKIKYNLDNTLIEGNSYIVHILISHIYSDDDSFSMYGSANATKGNLYAKLMDGSWIKLDADIYYKTYRSSISGEYPVIETPGDSLGIYAKKFVDDDVCELCLSCPEDDTEEVFEDLQSLDTKHTVNIQYTFDKVTLQDLNARLLAMAPYPLKSIGLYYENGELIKEKTFIKEKKQVCYHMKIMGEDIDYTSLPVKFYVEGKWHYFDASRKQGFPVSRDAELNMYKPNLALDAHAKAYGLFRRDYRDDVPYYEYSNTYPRGYPFDLEQDYWLEKRLLGEYTARGKDKIDPRSVQDMEDAVDEGDSLDYGEKYEYDEIVEENVIPDDNQFINWAYLIEEDGTKLAKLTCKQPHVNDIVMSIYQKTEKIMDELITKDIIELIDYEDDLEVIIERQNRAITNGDFSNALSNWSYNDATLLTENGRNYVRIEYEGDPGNPDQIERFISQDVDLTYSYDVEIDIRVLENSFSQLPNHDYVDNHIQVWIDNDLVLQLDSEDEVPFTLDDWGLIKVDTKEYSGIHELKIEVKAPVFTPERDDESGEEMDEDDCYCRLDIRDVYINIAGNIEEYEFTDTYTFVDEVNKNSALVTAEYLNSPNDSLVYEVKYILAEGNYKRFGLVPAEVFSYLGKFPTIKNMWEYAIIYDRKYWDNDVWAGDLFMPGVFRADIMYPLYSNFKFIENTEINTFLKKCKKLGTEALSAYQINTGELKIGTTITTPKIIPAQILYIDLNMGNTLLRTFENDGMLITEEMLKMGCKLNEFIESEDNSVIIPYITPPVEVTPPPEEEEPEPPQPIYDNAKGGIALSTNVSYHENLPYAHFAHKRTMTREIASIPYVELYQTKEISSFAKNVEISPASFKGNTTISKKWNKQSYYDEDLGEYVSLSFPEQNATTNWAGYLTYSNFDFSDLSSDDVILGIKIEVEGDFWHDVDWDENPSEMHCFIFPHGGTLYENQYQGGMLMYRHKPDVNITFSGTDDTRYSKVAWGRGVGDDWHNTSEEGLDPSAQFTYNMDGVTFEDFNLEDLKIMIENRFVYSANAEESTITNLKLTLYIEGRDEGIFQTDLFEATQPTAPSISTWGNLTTSVSNLTPGASVTYDIIKESHSLSNITHRKYAAFGKSNGTKSVVTIDGDQVYDFNARSLLQIFIANSNAISSIRLKGIKIGNPTDSIRVSLFEMEDGYPKHRIAYTDITWIDGEMEVNIVGIPLTIGNQYGIRVSRNGIPNNTNYYAISVDDNSNYQGKLKLFDGKLWENTNFMNCWFIIKKANIIKQNITTPKQDLSKMEYSSFKVRGYMNAGFGNNSPRGGGIKVDRETKYDS